VRRSRATCLLSSGVALCALLQACSPALPPPQSDVGVAPPGVQTPLPLPTATEPNVAAPPASDEAIPDLKDAPALSSFEPLLSAPELRLAAESVGREDFTTAAREVANYIKLKAPSPADAVPWQLLLGTLREKAGDVPGAIEQYERASQSAWPLVDYAALGLGRCLAGLGEIDRARRELTRVPEDSVAVAPARALLAEIACRQGDAPGCLAHLAKFAHAPKKPIGWAAQTFRIIEMLMKEVVQPRLAQAAIDTQVGTLDLIRALVTLAPGTAARFDVPSLERALLDVLPEKERRDKEQVQPAERLARAEAMESAGRNEDADSIAGALLSDLGPGAFGPIACQARLVQGKALTDLRQRERALARFTEIAKNCKGDDLVAWSLYFAGRGAFQDKAYPEADRLFADLERALPRHRLADDARWYRAQAQLEMGVEARFSELLDRMADDYPKGDMTLDGVFALALRRMEKGDWSGASSVLGRAVRLVGPNDVQRGQESSGRERYFEARAMIETGQVTRGLAQYEALIAELPLSYYMLNAYSRLYERDAARAQRALAASIARVQSPPFRIEERPEFEQPGFLRAMELLRQGDVDSARREFDSLETLGSGATPPVLWGVATLYARAGSARHSHALPRWQMVDWLERWPTGTWKDAWDLAFPRPHIEAVTTAAKHQGIEPALVYAVMREESAFDAAAVSSANAYGLMQVISPTARHYGKQAGLPTDRRALTTPEISIAIGSRVLASYRDRFFPDDPLLTIPGYNAGPGRPIRWVKDWPSVDFDVWVELIPFRETRRYTKRVLASRASYGFLYYRSADAGSADADPLRLPRRLSGSSTTN
jgi:soluble lytic murein transglycosylase